MRRISAALTLPLLSALCASALAACGGSGEDPAASADDLAAAFASAPVPKASAFDGVVFAGATGAAVAKEYAEVVAGMDGIRPAVSVASVDSSSGGRTATLEWSWPVVENRTPWTYTSTVDLVAQGSGWALKWARKDVQPKLGEHDVLNALTLPARRGEISGAGGEVLVKARPVEHVGIDRSRVPAARAATSARTLARLVGIAAPAYVKAVRGAGDKAFVEAITYRKGDVPGEVAHASIPGLLTVSGSLPLAPTKEFAAPILGRVGPVTAEQIKADPSLEAGDQAGLSGLQERYDADLRGEAGRLVRIETPGTTISPRTMFKMQPAPGKPLRLTLDERLQEKAEALLAGVRPGSAIVAIRPSDGAILAAANGPGNDGQNFATYGRFAPGSTFKIVSSLALLRAGLTPRSPVPCPATTSVDGKGFKNDRDFPSSAIGTISLSQALAQSCNTAFIGQRAKVGKRALAEAAATLGFGVDHDAGFPAYFGQVPAAASETEAAADLIGQGKILASPMAVATEMASVVAGHTVVPHLVDRVKVTGSTGSTGSTGADPLTRTEATRLRAMLRDVVETGTGRGLLGLPGPPVIAKTGTAEFDAGGANQTHTWMVAGQGDLAVAVFVDVGITGAQTSGPILADFLRAAR